VIQFSFPLAGWWEEALADSSSVSYNKTNLLKKYNFEINHINDVINCYD